MNYFQEKTKQLNSRKTKPRYKAKRERRAYLTEAFVDSELHLYKPEHKPYFIYKDRPINYADIHTEMVTDSTDTSGEGGFDVTIEKDTVTFSPHKIEQVEKEIKLNPWQKLMNFIDSIFIKFRKRFYEKK